MHFCFRFEARNDKVKNLCFCSLVHSSTLQRTPGWQVPLSLDSDSLLWVNVIANRCGVLCSEEIIVPIYSKDINQNINTAWFKKVDSISYVYISWTIHGMWMIYITFERGGSKFSNTTARAPAYLLAAASVESKMATMQHKIFAFVSSLKLSRRLLYIVRFVFVSTFNLQRGTAFVVGITNLSK